LISKSICLDKLLKVLLYPNDIRVTIVRQGQVGFSMQGRGEGYCLGQYKMPASGLWAGSG